MPKRGDAKYGSAGVQDQQSTERIRRQRAEKLAEDAFNVKESPYYHRGVGGSLECRLCHTIQRSTAHFILHLQGRKHKLREMAYQENRERRKKRQQEVEGWLARRADAGRTGEDIDDDVDPAAAPPLVGRPSFDISVVGEKSRPIITIAVSFPIPDTLPPPVVAAARDAVPCHRVLSAAEVGARADRMKAYVVFGTSPSRGFAAYRETVPVDKNGKPVVDESSAVAAGTPLWAPICVEIPAAPIAVEDPSYCVEWDDESRRYTLYIPLMIDKLVEK